MRPAWPRPATDAQPSVAAIAAALESVEQLKAQVVAELEQDAVEMALRLAEQILAGVLDVQPERVLDVGRNALRHLDRPPARDARGQPRATSSSSANASTSSSPSSAGSSTSASSPTGASAAGGAIARTDSGDIDAGIDTQLARAREIVAAALARDPSAREGESSDD